MAALVREPFLSNDVPAVIETRSTVTAINAREATERGIQTIANAPFNVSAANVQTRAKKVEGVE
jgi:hypothetical protein